MSEQQQQPVAWIFKEPDGRVKFVLHDAARAEAWGRHFEGTVIPLYERPQDCKTGTAQA